MNVKLNNEDSSSLHTVSDAFVTFLYAASVHLIIAHYARPIPMTVVTSLIVLFFIIFLFSDWLSRVRLPRLLPPADDLGIVKQLTKTILEVSGLFFLMLAWLANIEHFAETSDSDLNKLNPEMEFGFLAAALTPYIAFAFFLIATFCWNSLMLLVMRQLKWLNLALMGVNGTALDAKEVQVYAKRFWQFRKKLVDWAEFKTVHDDEHTYDNFLLRQPGLILEAFVRTGAQIVAVHIAWANLFAGIIILIGEFLFDGKSVGFQIWDKLVKNSYINYIIYPLEEWHWSIYIKLSLIIPLLISIIFVLLVNDRRIRDRFIPALVVYLYILIGTLIGVGLSIYLPRILFLILLLIFGPSVFFYLASQCNKKRKARWAILWMGGVFGLLMLILLYSIVDSKILMFIVAFQQVIINAFLQYAASGRPLITISPQKVAIPKEGTHQFNALVTGSPDTTIVWKATCGQVSEGGIYTAPPVGGSYKVCAVSLEDCSLFAEADITVFDNPPVSDVTRSAI